jgi:uncharacterized membrane protein YkvA (DUF1232 family)
LDAQVSAGSIAEALRLHATDVPAEDVDELAGVLEPYLRSVPDALATALAMSRHPQCGRAISFATGPILAYVFDDQDLLPEARFGVIGMLDDAYLVHTFVASLSRRYPFAAPSDTDYTSPSAEVSEVVASLLPDGVAASLLRTCEGTVQVAQTLFPAGPIADSDALVLEPTIRVAEAVELRMRASRI